jgi:hypothetical protein
MSKIRVFMLGLLAVCAVSAVASASASAEHIWLVNGAEANGQAVLDLGGLFTLTASTKVVTCHHVRSVGTVGPGDKDLATELDFLGCETNESGCTPLTAGAPAGLILVLNIPTLLTLRENSAGAQVLADEFKENATTKEFVTLRFVGTCTKFPLTKVTGNVAAAVNNATESLEFTSPELKGNTLKAFGVAAKLEGTSKQMLTAGGTLKAD